MTALDALESALRPSQAAEDVLSRLLAMGWEVVPTTHAWGRSDKCARFAAVALGEWLERAREEWPDEWPDDYMGLDWNDWRLIDMARDKLKRIGAFGDV